MKEIKLPKNKFLKLLINVGFIVAWFFVVKEFWQPIHFQIIWFFNKFANPFDLIYTFQTLLVLVVPIFLITRYIWFEKSRNRIFYGLFNKLNFNLKKFEPRIYTTTSNADELKKYSELRDKGIITEEEFQTKKKKLLDL
tara:strand:- start:572 stop:988 length:417 start_codon:yes stop_codon:yes gene_type:complete